MKLSRCATDSIANFLSDDALRIIEGFVLATNRHHHRLVCKRWRAISLFCCKRSGFHVPVARGPSGVGRVRDHFFALEVSSSVFNKISFSPENPESWPPASDVSPLCIVVVRGLQQDGHGAGYAWYCRVKPRTTNPQAVKAVYCLRRMPGEYVDELLSSIFSDVSMRRSSLILHFQPTRGNAPILGVANGFTSKIGRLRLPPPETPEAYDFEGIPHEPIVLHK